MEFDLKEITNIAFLNNNILTSHCLTSDNSLEVCLNNRLDAEVVRIHFDNTDQESLNICTSIDFPSTINPTLKICSDAAALFDACEESQKQHLTIDRLLLPELSNDNEIWFEKTELSPDIGVGAPYLAVLTNFGHCQIKQKHITDQKWTYVLADLTNIWKSHLQIISQPNVESDSSDFKKFVAKAHAIKFTSFAWANQIELKSLSIVCTSAQGHCVFFNLLPELVAKSSAKVVHVADLKQTARINHVKWIVIGSDSFLCTANVLGHVQLYRVVLNPNTKQIETVQLCADIIKWQMICSIDWLELEYDAKTNQLIALIAVGSRIAVAFIPVVDIKSFEIIYHHSFQQAVITGISKITPFEYGVCTLCGSVQKISINVLNRILDIHTFSTNVNVSKFKMMGLSVSSNQSLWIFALFPRQPFDHLVVRHPVQMSFCSQTPQQVLTIIKQRPRIEMDCLEALRVYQIRYEEVLEYSNLMTVDALHLHDDGLVHELRLRLGLLNACFSYVRRKLYPNDLQALMTEIDFIRSTLTAISFYRRLENTTFSPNSPSRLVLSGKNILQYLSRYVAEKSHTSYSQLTINICTQISMTIQIQEVNMSESKLSLMEYCHHCDISLECGCEKCSSGHMTSRCCITFLQLPVVSNRSCLQCGARALNLDNILEIYQKDGTEVLCPVCSVCMTTSKYA